MSRAGMYLDNAASTPVDPRVIEVMADALARHGANPTAAHEPGRQAAEALAQAREPVAAAIGAQPADLVWTSGASEANNLAIQGVAAAFARQPGHMITLCTEHPAVLGPMAALEAQGWAITRLPVDADGFCDPAALAAALRPDTRLVSVMQVNNETGVCQDLAVIGEALRDHPAALHVDAAQGAGKLPLDVDAIGASSLAAGHKTLIPELIGHLRDADRADIKVIAGGVIPQKDYDFLRDAGVQGIYGPGSNVVECAADVLRLLGHNMPPAGEDLGEAAE